MVRIKHNRKKAILGASEIIGIVGTGLNLINSGVSYAEQKAAQRRQQAEIDKQNANAFNQQISNTVNNVIQNNENFDNETLTNKNIIYRKGGRKKLRNAPAVTDGGIAIPIGNNEFLLQGNTHEQVNETGKTGIGIDTGKGEIEVQDGEIIVPGRKYLRVYSDEPIINGMSPAELIAAGADKDKVFNVQERFKNEFGLDSEGNPVKGKRKLRNAGRRKARYGFEDDDIWKEKDIDNQTISDVFKRVSAFDNLDKRINEIFLGIKPSSINQKVINYPLSNQLKNNIVEGNNTMTLPKDNGWGLDLTKSDYALAGIQALGSLGINLFNGLSAKNKIRNYALPEFIEEAPVRFNTNYNINPQLADIERNRLNTNKLIYNNSSSSSNNLNRMQKTMTEALNQRGKAFQEKENKELELINKEAESLQQVRGRNAAAKNQWLQTIAGIKNKQIDANIEAQNEKSKYIGASFEGLANAATNMIRQGQQRYYDRENQLIMAEAANPGSIYRLASSGALNLNPRQLATLMVADYNNNINPGERPKRTAGGRPEQMPDETSSDYLVRLQNWKDLKAQEDADQKIYDTKYTPYIESVNRRNVYYNMLMSTKRGRNLLRRMNYTI